MSKQKYKYQVSFLYHNYGFGIADTIFYSCENGLNTEEEYEKLKEFIKTCITDGTSVGLLSVIPMTDTKVKAHNEKKEFIKFEEVR